MILNVYDYNATEETEYEDIFKVFPIDKTSFDTAFVTDNSAFGILRAVSALFKKRHNNIILITISDIELLDSRTNYPQLIDTICSAFEQVISIYGSRLNILIVTDILKYVPIDDRMRFLNFFSLDGMISYRDDDNEIMVYKNDIGGNLILKLAKINEG